MLNKQQIYINEFTKLKPQDGVNCISKDISGYMFLSTYGHGYLIIPKEDKNYNRARQICKYGFVGDNAIYLEEDCEINEFLEVIK